MVCGAANIKDAVLTVDRPSPIRFGEVIADRPPEAMQQRFADWLVLPAACPVMHPSQYHAGNCGASCETFGYLHLILRNRRSPLLVIHV